MSDVLFEILEPKLAERDAKRDAERDAKRDAERDAVHDAELKKQYSVFNCARRKNVFGICCSMVTSVHPRVFKSDETEWFYHPFSRNCSATSVTFLFSSYFPNCCLLIQFSMMSYLARNLTRFQVSDCDHDRA